MAPSQIVWPAGSNPEPDHQPLTGKTGQSTTYCNFVLGFGQLVELGNGKAIVDAVGQFDGVEPTGADAR